MSLKQATLNSLLFFCFTFSAYTDKPNILFILLDDLGKEWISHYGADEVKTPHIDKMAKEGMTFQNYYSMPQCTPTRIAFMTGQYPYRNGWINHWDVPRWGAGCHYDWNKNPSIARVMQSAGYKTAVAGKWQINDFRVQPEAMTHHGFDDYCMWTGYEAGNKPSGKRYWDPYIHTKEGSKTYEGQFGEDIFSDFMIDFMRKNSDSPMFMYYAMCLPHGPLVSTPLEPNVTDKMDKHKAMVRYVDFILGKLLKALDEQGLKEKTMVVFTTDNGTSGSILGSLKGRPVQGGKAKTTENGINGPFIIHQPGTVPANTVSHALCDVTDLLPTFAQLGGASLPTNYDFDGTSFADVITGKSKLGQRKWAMSMGGKNNAARTEKGVENQWTFRDRVVRNQQFKLWISPERKPVKLVDLSTDLTEEKNLIDHPEYANIVKELFQAIEANPRKDNDPIYEALPAEDWDVEIKAKSQLWKTGKPGEMVDYIPDSQAIKAKSKKKKK